MTRVFRILASSTATKIFDPPSSREILTSESPVFLGFLSNRLILFISLRPQLPHLGKSRQSLNLLLILLASLNSAMQVRRRHRPLQTAAPSHTPMSCRQGRCPPPPPPPPELPSHPPGTRPPRHVATALWCSTWRAHPHTHAPYGTSCRTVRRARSEKSARAPADLLGPGRPRRRWCGRCLPSPLPLNAGHVGRQRARGAVLCGGHARGAASHAGSATGPRAQHQPRLSHAGVAGHHHAA